MDRDTDGPGLVCDGAGNGLADPPGGVCGELVALGVVKLLYRFDEAQVALLNEVQEEHSPAHVPFGNRHHQPEIGLRQALFGGLALTDGALELLLLLLREGDLFSILPRLFDFGQLFPGCVPRAHVLSQLDLLVGGEQIYLADLLEVHPYRVVDAEGVHQGVGVHDLLLGDLLDLLDRGDLIHQFGKIVLSRGVDAHIFHGVVNLIELLALQIHFLQDVHELAGGEFALLFALVQQFRQLFRALNPLDDLHQLDLAGFDLFLTGHLRLLIGLSRHIQHSFLTHGFILHTLFSLAAFSARPKARLCRLPACVFPLHFL